MDLLRLIIVIVADGVAAGVEADDLIVGGELLDAADRPANAEQRAKPQQIVELGIARPRVGVGINAQARHAGPAHGIRQTRLRVRGEAGLAALRRHARRGRGGDGRENAGG